MFYCVEITEHEGGRSSPVYFTCWMYRNMICMILDTCQNPHVCPMYIQSIVVDISGCSMRVIEMDIGGNDLI